MMASLLDGIRDVMRDEAGEEWWQQANCTSVDPDERARLLTLFYPPEPDKIPAECVRRCADCAVVTECRDYGLRHEVYGVWGGMSEEGRHRLRRTARIFVRVPGTYYERRAAPVAAFDDGDSGEVDAWRNL